MFGGDKVWRIALSKVVGEKVWRIPTAALRGLLLLWNELTSEKSLDGLSLAPERLVIRQICQTFPLYGTRIYVALFRYYKLQLI